MVRVLIGETRVIPARGSVAEWARDTRRWIVRVVDRSRRAIVEKFIF